MERASVDFYDALISAGVPVEMNLFDHGHHGSGLGMSDPALDLWTMVLEQWLRGQGLLTFKQSGTLDKFTTRPKLLSPI